MEGSGCRRINLDVSHESVFFWRWPIDMESRFGAGARAKVDGGGEPQAILHFGSQVVRYEAGTSREIAVFRVPQRPHRHYMITLNDYALRQ